MANIPRPGNSFPSFQRSPPNSMRTAMNVAKNKECNLEYRCGCERRGNRTDCDADDCGQRTDADYLGDHRTLLFMSEIGTHRRGHDDR